MVFKFEIAVSHHIGPSPGVEKGKPLASPT
jgi:hypothetical protein